MKTGNNSRLTFIGGALSLAGLFIFVWMVRIQTSDYAKELRDRGNSYNYVTKTIYPERGYIYDRWGHLLAGNVEVYELGVDFRYIKDPKNIAMTLGNILGLDANDTYNKLDTAIKGGKQVYMPLDPSVSIEKITEIEALQKQLDDQAAKVPEKKQKDMPSLDGLIWTPRLQRSYPEHSLASTILGFFSFKDRDSGTGYFGVEQKYNHLLAGTPIQVVVPQDPTKITELPSTPPGVSLVLTIDREVQAMVEKELAKAVKDNGAASGTIIIMDPRNGEILAMASTPQLDLTEYWKYSDTFKQPTPYNRAVEQTFEPGSVFKILTMAIGLDTATVTPDTQFLDTGVIVVGGVPIRNWDRAAWGPQTMEGCMAHSLNVCLAWVATKIGPTKFYAGLQRFGVGHLTGVDISGEVNYPLAVPGDPNWYEVNLGTNAFGQGVAITPIQMLTAVTAVANRQGKMMAPHILKATIDNGERFDNPTQVIGTPISADTARTLTDMLATSVENETKTAKVPGYRVAGKTGTAEIAGPEGYTTSLTNASFIGWGPADDPRFLVYVWLEKPTTSPWGSVVAAPIFSDVVKNLVVLMDLPPDDVRLQLAGKASK